MIRNPNHIIRKASGESGGDSGYGGNYAFKTLWQEITRAVGYLMDGLTNLGETRSNNSREIAEKYWTTADSGEDSRSSNIGFYAILAAVVIVFVIGYVVKKKKK